jgi:hypothetical protein
MNPLNEIIHSKHSYNYMVKLMLNAFQNCFVEDSVLYLRYDGWCIYMGLSGRFVGSKESPNCNISNECHLHSCLKLLSDV